MRGRYILLVGLAVVAGLVWAAQGESSAYDACVGAGKQSNATCLKYTR